MKIFFQSKSMIVYPRQTLSCTVQVGAISHRVFLCSIVCVVAALKISNFVSAVNNYRQLNLAMVYYDYTI